MRRIGRHNSATATLASLYGSVPALPDESLDLEREIDEAMQAEANAFVATSAERQGIPLATFDTDFDQIPGIARWQPPLPKETSDADG
jgi:hypothetical protein